MCSPRYSPWGFPQDIHADLSSHTSLLDLYWFWQFIQTKFCFWTPPEKFHSLVELVVHLLSFLPQRGCSGRSRSALLPQQTVLIDWLSFHFFDTHTICLTTPRVAVAAAAHCSDQTGVIDCFFVFVLSLFTFYWYKGLQKRHFSPTKLEWWIALL